MGNRPNEEIRESLCADESWLSSGYSYDTIVETQNKLPAEPRETCDTAQGSITGVTGIGVDTD